LWGPGSAGLTPKPVPIENPGRKWTDFGDENESSLNDKYLGLGFVTFRIIVTNVSTTTFDGETLYSWKGFVEVLDEIGASNRNGREWSADLEKKYIPPRVVVRGRWLASGGGTVTGPHHPPSGPVSTKPAGPTFPVRPPVTSTPKPTKPTTNFNPTFIPGF
jgi:hypothetical protein